MAIVIGLLEIFTAFVFFIFFQCLLLHKKTPKPLLTNWPALGMLPGLLLQVPRIYDWITEVLEATDMTFCFKGPCLSGMDILLTVDPVNIHYILSSNFANYPKGMEFKKIFEVVGDSIFNVDSGLWEDMRNSSHAIFSNQDFQMFWVSTSVSKLRQGLVPILENAADKNILVDLQDLFQRFLFDTSLILMTGYDPKCLSVEMPKVEFGDAVDGVSDGVFYRHVKPVFLWRLQYLIGVGVEKRLKRGLAVFDQLLEKIITAKREEINSHGTHHPSRGEAIDNPEAINKIRQEVNKKMPRFDPADLEKLVYLHGAVCETLRLYPPVPFNHKSPAKPDVLPSGHRVDEKWKIVISMYALGRMKSVWGDDAEDFRPERWISDSGRLKHEPSYKFLAFNAGPRACLGKKLTFLQMKTVAAEIIRNYDIKVVEGHKTEPVPSVLFRMQHGLKVNITRI
ncbi:Cytochrome P450 [Arabidopsis suecica]|uniref:Cytochrome P450 n=1 Tax=Arabidopsis suecica TaxID=45249 RepID=A0A8T2HE21_ARASU|nr:Cytochrome P450 [Arabidopsis suecica]